MFRTLYSRLAAALVILFAAVAVNYILLTMVTTNLYQQEVTQKLNRDLAGHIASGRLLMRNGKIDQEALKELFDTLMVINPSIEIYLLDPTGKILAFSAPPGRVRLDRVSLEPARRFLKNGSNLPILGDDPRHPDRRKVFSVVALPASEGTPEVESRRIDGYLYIILAGEEYDSVAARLRGSYILQQSAGVAIASVLFAFLAALLIFHLLTRRLARLTEAVETLRREDFSEVAHLPRGEAGDEVDRLAEAVDEMSSRIVLQMERLKETDALRRELVANVSHDLRTPLAALRGFIDTLLMKHDSLSDEQQREYLEIASRHSDRLATLIAELFELSRLESNETKPLLEACSMGELAQDIVQKFNLAAAEKGVTLRTNSAEDLPYASVDIGLMERVLENLIGNSIRYTAAGGEVEIAIDRDGDELRIRVSDTGEGIHEDDLPHIFDRFYRAAQHEPKKSQGSGLGLAIARKIVELHGASLEATSKVGLGTTFTFHAPLLRSNS